MAGVSAFLWFAVFAVCWTTFFCSGCKGGARSRTHCRAGSPGVSHVSICRPRKKDVCDDLESLREAMRKLECLLVVYENQESADPDLPVLMTNLHDEIVEKLVARNRWDGDAAIWETLYFYTSRLNAVRNSSAKESKIPVYSVNGHHMAAAYWIEASRKQPVKTLLHFDSHADTRAVADPDKILKLGKNILKGEDVDNSREALGKYLRDPAVPISAAVLVLGIKRLVWAKPSWYNLTDFVSRVFFYGKHVSPAPGKETISNKWELFYDRSADPVDDPEIPPDSTWKILDDSAEDLGEFSHVRKLLLSVLTTNPWPEETARQEEMKKRLLKAVPRGRFILDIDLDYFASVDLTKDLAPGVVPASYSDRRKYLSAEAVKKREETWRDHRVSMEKRLDELEEILRFLRDNGRMPMVVTVADSTRMPFSIHWWAQQYWEYTPKRFVPYLQHRVRLLLARVYEADSMKAVL